MNSVQSVLRSAQEVTAGSSPGRLTDRRVWKAQRTERESFSQMSVRLGVGVEGHEDAAVIGTGTGGSLGIAWSK